MIDKCLICSEKDAIQTNSHIIPSFLVAMVASYDGSYKRGKELMVTMDAFQEKVYVGALPDTKLETIFDTDRLTDERIKNELSKSTVALDYIFCPTCEKKLSHYLEAPYSTNLLQDKKIDNDIPLFFWISVIWRMSIAGNHGFKLPQDIENRLHEYLAEYFSKKDNKEDISSLLRGMKFYYKILHCKDFSKVNSGSIYCRYDEEDKILTMFIGDMCVCIMFESENLPENFKFFQLEDFLQKAKINKGNQKEERLQILPEIYQTSLEELTKLGSQERISGEFQIMDMLWMKSGRFGIMPIKMKIIFLQMLYDRSIKLGEQHTPQRYINIFNYLKNNVILWC